MRYTGHWFLPGTPQHRVLGAATVEHIGGIRLEVFGHLEREPESASVPIPEIVLGETSDGGVVTLYKGLSATGAPSSDKGEFRYQFAYLIGGHHFDRAEDIAFVDVELSYSGLEAWLGTHSLRITNTPESNTAVIDYSRSINSNARINSIDGTVAVRTSISVASPVERERGRAFAGVSAQTVVEFQMGDRRLPLLEIVKYADQLANFFAFAVGGPVSPREWMRGFVGATTERQKGRRPGVNIFRPAKPQGRGRPHLPGSSSAWREFFRTNLARMVDGWFEGTDRFSTARDLYLDVARDEVSSAARQLLVLTQSVESYDRSAGYNKEISDMQHAERVRAILAAAPEKHKKWLQERLQYSNEASLRVRLKRLFKQYKTCFPDDSQPTTGLVHDIVTMRNKLTHGIGRANQERGLEALRACGMLRVLAEACLLTSIGISINDVCCLLADAYPNEMSIIARTSIGR